MPTNKNTEPQTEIKNQHASIYAAEAHAIDMALEIIDSSSQSSFLVISDSLSCLTSLGQVNTLDPIILKLKLKFHNLSQKGKNINFVWIPSHMGIKGNEEADSLAKKALKSEINNDVKIPSSDYKQYINELIRSIWEKRWREEKEKSPPNKLSEIKYKLGPRKNPGLKRWDSVIYTRLKLGHTDITQYLLTHQEMPFCEGCNEYYTVKHILLNCIEFSDIREKYYKCKDLKALFDAIDPQSIINFIKEIGIYNKI